MEFYWKDPIPEKESNIEINLPHNVWRYYYNLVAAIIQNRSIGIIIEPDDSIDGIHIFIEDYDIELHVHRAISKHLELEEWEMARSAAIEAKDDIEEARYQLDGLLVQAGKSWCEEYIDYPYYEY